jgi:hypothetical protein
MLSDVFAYSIAKLDDWSWGTKSEVGAVADALTVNDARLRRAARARLSCATTSLVVAQILLMLIFSITYFVLKAQFAEYLIIPSILPAASSLGLMAGSIFYYFQRAMHVIFSCQRRGATVEQQVAHVIAAILRAGVFGAWCFVVLVYIWYVVHTYLHVSNAVLESFIPNDPLMMLLILIAVVVVLTLAQVVYTFAQAAPLAPNAHRRSIGEKFFACIIGVCCLFGALSLVSLVMLLIANNVVWCLTSVRDAIRRCLGYQRTPLVSTGSSVSITTVSRPE